MKISITGSRKMNGRSIYKCFALLFLFVVLSASGVYAQSDSSATAGHDSNAVATGENELLKNMKKTGSVMTEEVKKMKERQAREEFLGYVYMVLGFGLVIFVAWFSTVKAKQYRERQDEAKRKFLEQKMANQAKGAGHHPPHRSAHKKGPRR